MYINDTHRNFRVHFYSLFIKRKEVYIFYYKEKFITTVVIISLVLNLYKFDVKIFEFLKIKDFF